MSLRVDQIEEAIAARITAVATLLQEPFDQSSATRDADAFHEAENPLVPQGSARPLGHLLFWVLADGAPVIGDRQTPGDEAKTRSPVTVSFLYRLRAATQRADQRLAARASSVIVRAVKALPQSEWDARVLDSWRPLVSADGEWLQADIPFSVLYDQPV